MAKGRAKGTGYLYKDPQSGIFHVQWTINGIRRRKSLKVMHRRDKTLEDGSVAKGAETLAAEFLSPGLQARIREEVITRIAEQKGIIRAGDMTLHEAFAAFTTLYRREHTVEDNTFLNYERQWNRFAKWVRDNHPEISGLRQVTEETAREYWSNFSRCSASTANQHLTTLKVLFTTLRNQAGLLVNPWEDIKRRASDGIPREYLTPTDRDKLFASFKPGGENAHLDEEYSMLFNVGRWTGQRLGDCCLLEKKEVDFTKNQIVLTPKKTRRLNRTVIIPMLPEFRKLLHAWLKTVPTEEKQVFPRLAAAYRKQTKTVKDQVSDIFKQAGFSTTVRIPGRPQPTCVIGFHSFRGTFSTDLLNAGVPSSIVSAIVGDNISTIEKHYVKVNQTHIHDALAGVNIH